MGNIQDIVDIMKKGPEFATKLNDLKLNTKSVARGALDSTFQFPCLISDSVEFPMANAITRTLDHVYATFTQTWISMNSMFDMTIDPSPMSYLKKLHQNFHLENVNIDNLEVADEDKEEYLERVYNGEYRLFLNEEKTCGILVNAADKATAEMLESHKELLTEYMSEYDLSPLEPYNEDTLEDLNNAALAGLVNKADREREQRNLAGVKATERMQAPKISDTSIKKLNDLSPYAIQVRLIALNDKKEFVQYVDFIVGVKAILHVIESNDMTDNIARALQNKNVFFKFLKWTTGEIKLFKDLIFNVDNLKMDAIAKSEGKSPFFATLKRLKNRKIGFRNFTMPHALIPNATMVVTEQEVDYLQRTYAIDLRDAKTAKRLLSTLFLMTFIIVDKGTNAVSILYDGSNTYQVYALETLERDVNANSNQLQKEIGKMLSYAN